MTISYAKMPAGTTIKIGVTTIGEVTKITPPRTTAEEVDVTTLAETSGYRKYIQGFKDAGEMSFDYNYYPGDAGQTSLEAYKSSGAEATFTITFPTSLGATLVFSGFVKEIGPSDLTPEDALGGSCTVRVTGEPVLGTTASADVTTILIAADDGSSGLAAYAITPAWAATKYNYAATYTTDTDFTVKATSATHTMKLYIDDVYIQDLTTATASAIQLQSAGTTKIIKVVAYEAGKTPKTYTTALARIS